MKKVTILHFTDPMMGLSYEMEPIFRKLETHFDEKIIFTNVMSVLVKNVFDFVNPADLSVSMNFALEKYLVKLAKIYESEEKISGMPILMKKCKIFSEKNLSSKPLNLAYKTALIVDKEKAENFLYNLRFATVVENRITTNFDEILKIAAESKIDAEKFKKVFENDAEKALEIDLSFCEKLFIRTLPTFLIEYDGEGKIFHGILSYENFVEIISEMTNKKIQSKNFLATEENLKKLLSRHQKISSLEIKFAFDFEKIEDAEKFIFSYAEKNFLRMKKVKSVYFIESE